MRKMQTITQPDATSINPENMNLIPIIVLELLMKNARH